MQKYDTVSRCGCWHLNCRLDTFFAKMFFALLRKKSHFRCNESFSEPTHKHVPIVYCLVLVDSTGEVLFEECEYSPDGKAAELFVKKLLDLQDQLLNMAYRYKPMKLEESDYEKMRLQKNCFHCHRSFSKYWIEKLGPVCRDHSHYSGKFIG